MKRILCFISLLLGIIAVNAQNIAEIEAQADKWAENYLERPKAFSAYLQCINQTKDKKTHLRLIEKAYKLIKESGFRYDENEQKKAINYLIEITSTSPAKKHKHYLPLIETTILLVPDYEENKKALKLYKKAIEIRKANKALYGERYEQLLLWYIKNMHYRKEVSTNEIIELRTDLCDTLRVNNHLIDSLYINMLNRRAARYTLSDDYQDAIKLYEINKEFIKIKKGKSSEEYIKVLNELSYSYGDLYEKLYGYDCFDLKPEKEKEIEYNYEILQLKILLDLEIYVMSDVEPLLIDLTIHKKDTIKAREIAIEYKTHLEHKNGKENEAYCKALRMEIDTYKDNDANTIPLLKELLSLQEKVLGTESIYYILTQGELSETLRLNYQMQEAISLLESNINEDNITDLHSLRSLATNQFLYGEYRSAITTNKKILELEIANSSSINEVIVNIVDYYFYIKDIDGLFEFGIKYSNDDRLNNEQQKFILTQVINRAIFLEYLTKSGDRTINIFEKSLSRLVEEKEFLIYKAAGCILSQPKKAEEICRQLIQLSKEENSNIHTIIKYEQYLELCLMQQEQFDEALELNKKTESTMLKLPEYENSRNLDATYCRAIVYNDKKNNFDEVIKIYNKLTHFEEPSIDELMENFYNRYNIFQIATTSLDKSSISRQIYRALYNKGLIDDAEELIDKELADWIATAKYNLTNMQKSSANFNDIINNFAVLSNKDSLIIKAFDCTLLQKQAFLTAEAIMNQQILNSGNKELVEKYNNLQNLRLSIQQYKAKGLPTDELDEQALVLHTQLVEDSKFYGDFTKSLNLTWKDIQEILKPDEIAIEFISYVSLEDNNKHIAALILRSGWDVPKVVKLFSEKDIPGNIYDNSDFSKLCWGPISEYLDNVKYIYFAPDGALYNIGIESLLNPNGKGYMADKYNLYRISSTRELVMRPEKSRTEKQKAIIYGGIDYKHQDIVTASSTEQSEQTTENIEIIRDIRGAVSGISYLPGTKSEAESIATILNSDKKYDEARLFTGANGTEQSFRAFSGEGINVAHIATHGFYRKDDKEQNQSILTLTPPEDNTLTRAGLLFAGAENTIFADSTYSEENDGILTALEISTLDLSSLDIITLGACQTAIGEITSDGVFGLQRGFKKAGVNTILMSLWSVDDNATTLFMTEFYKNWINGKSKHDALESAKKVVRSHKEKGWDNPKYWAPFILLDGLD